ncbi:unnamed protein product [Absidia cylindrospora]
MDHTEFRHKVYAMSLKALSDGLSVADYTHLRSIVNSYQPISLAHYLDKMAASLILKGKLDSDTDMIALKLATSHVVDCMNPRTRSLFCQYINNDQLWTQPTSPSVISAPGLTTDSKQLFNRMIQLGKDSDGIIKKNLINQAICKLKLELYQANEQDQELFQILDVVSVVLKFCRDADSAPTQARSELTFYRKVAQLLDIIMEDTYLDLQDRTCLLW